MIFLYIRTTNEKCIICNEFEVKSKQSYVGHINAAHKDIINNKKLIDVDFKYYQKQFDNLHVKVKRKILLREANYKCTQCGFDERRKTGEHILEMDHIDGNIKNNERSNLRILCPNCHTLTDTFRNYGNKGNKRRSSRVRENRNEEYIELINKIALNKEEKIRETKG